MKIQTMRAASLMMIALLACGCTRQISRGLSDDGKVDEVVFANERFLGPDGGSYPGPAALQRLGPGMTKAQLMGLVGPPHYREGFAAREWDYLFLFRTAQGDRSCHYKVVFDRQYRARTLLWNPESCADWLKSQASADRPEAIEPKPSQRVSSSSQQKADFDQARPSPSH